MGLHTLRYYFYYFLGNIYLYHTYIIHFIHFIHIYLYHTYIYFYLYLFIFYTHFTHILILILILIFISIFIILGILTIFGYILPPRWGDIGGDMVYQIYSTSRRQYLFCFFLTHTLRKNGDERSDSDVLSGKLSSNIYEYSLRLLSFLHPTYTPYGVELNIK